MLSIVTKTKRIQTREVILSLGMNEDRLPLARRFRKTQEARDV